MASASDHRAHAALQPADCLMLLPQRLPAAVETSIGPAHYPAECTQSDAFLQPSLRARKGRANSNSLSLIAGLTVLFFAALVPNSVRAGIMIIRSPITAGGYAFTNFDFSPLSGAATGSNVNGISNTGQVVGTTVDVNGAPTFTNFSGTPPTLTQLNTGAGQTAFGINSAGNVVGGNGTNAFYLPNGGLPQNLTTPPGAINAFGINDNGNIVGQFTSGANTPGFILPSIASNTFTTINQPAGVTADTINAQGINNNGRVVGFYLGNDGQVHGFTANTTAAPGG